MKNMRLNKVEMANIYGGTPEAEFYIDDDSCAKVCETCYPGQTEAKEALKEHQINSDSAWGR
jgi:hypothetical protein